MGTPPLQLAHKGFRYAKYRAKILRAKGVHNRNRTTFARDARPGPTAELFSRVRAVPGWFTYDDASHFALVLRTQTVTGVVGDILEIGSYHGRSTGVLASHLRPGERLTVCDPFRIGAVYIRDPPSPALLLSNVQRIAPDVALECIEVIEAYSIDLKLPEERLYRFIHIDGSHEAADVLHDLRLARRHLAPGGVLVADDNDHPDWPGVTEALRTFRAEHPELLEVADVNRHAESGRKLYLGLPRIS